MKVNGTKGKLVIIGGGEDKEGECTILKEFVRLAGEAKARIAVMTVATDKPKEYADAYQKVFKKLGVAEAQMVDVSRRKDAHDPQALEIIEQATGIFFTGGDQLHITSLMGGTRMQELIRKKYEEGAIIGGTSAGAAMMSNSMIIRGESNCSPRFGGMDIGPGMDFLRDTMIDTHFSQRGRFGRLLTAIAHYPQDIGFGIDENTALVVTGGQCEVIGENTVTVVDAGDINYTNLPNIEWEQALAIHGVKIHVLSTGHKFDFEKRVPVDEADGAVKAKAATAEKAKD